VVVILRLLALRVGRGSLLCVIVHREMLSKSCVLAYISMVLYSGLASLLKWVIPVCLTSGLCEYPTYRLILLVFVASIPMPYFDPVDVYVSCALSWKNPQLLACLLMTSLSLLCGEHYTVVLTLLTQISMGALFVSFWLGTGFYLVAHYVVLKEVLGSLVFWKLQSDIGSS
jgi:hypothetical protein